MEIGQITQIAFLTFLPTATKRHGEKQQHQKTGESSEFIKSNLAPEVTRAQEDSAMMLEMPNRWWEPGAEDMPECLPEEEWLPDDEELPFK